MTATSPPILLLEQDADLREVLVEVLSLEGLPIICPTHEAEALEWLGSGPLPALVLLDVWLPGRKGGALLEQLGAVPRYAAVPVVALSTVEVHHPCVRRTLRKPFDMADLVALVRELLAAP